jgi:hypothetical protein
MGTAVASVVGTYILLVVRAPVGDSLGVGSRLHALAAPLKARDSPAPAPASAPASAPVSTAAPNLLKCNDKLLPSKDGKRCLQSPPCDKKNGFVVMPGWPGKF